MAHHPEFSIFPGCAVMVADSKQDRTSAVKEKRHGAERTNMIDEWLDAEVPRITRAILDGDAPPGTLAEQVREVLLPHLPAVGRLTALEAQQQVVRLGFVGA